ncbi:MAG TPA: ABC-type transport auxiliary lipoprotein family protein, partial [Chthoniobacterales bacterium]|nr:ABC-type transport auxiliary lipoprotein family protein [Chthoniobacterales bacterium]
MIEIGRKLLILTGIIVSGCATREPLATFYTLDPGGDIHSATKQSVGRSVRVYVNRVILPPYLNRTNLASFRNNQVEYSTWAFWAIPLDQAIAQAVARDLSAAGVSAFGFDPMASPPPHSYEVTVRITRCEGYDSGDVVLSGV